MTIPRGEGQKLDTSVLIGGHLPSVRSERLMGRPTGPPGACTDGLCSYTTSLWGPKYSTLPTSSGGECMAVLTEITGVV